MKDSNFNLKRERIIENVEFQTQDLFYQYYEYGGFPRTLFLNCKFRNIVTDGTFGSCRFEKCVFENVQGPKTEFFGCSFNNCQIINSVFRRAEFYDSQFLNVEFQNLTLQACSFAKCKFQSTQFIEVNLESSDFEECQFQTTKFQENNLDLFQVQKVQIFKDSQWVEINDVATFIEKLATSG